MTQTEKFLQFFFSHQLMLIEVLFAAILAICVIWLFFHLQKDDDDSATASELEKILHRVLEKTNSDLYTNAISGEIDLSTKPVATAAVGAATHAAPVAPAAPIGPKPIITPLSAPTPMAPLGPVTPASPALVVTASATPTPVPVMATAPTAVAPTVSTTAATPVASTAPSVDLRDELSKLKKETEEKSMRVAALERSLEEARKASADAAAAAAASAGAGANTVEFQKKIKDLESRLSEYEIIEDDIANLSLYKEENVRLKNELDKLKSGAVVAAPTQKAAVESVSTQDVKVDTDKLVSQATELAEAPEPTTPSAPVEDKDSGQKLIDEFENFMKGAGR